IGTSLLTRHGLPAAINAVPWLAEIQQPPATLPPDAPQLADLLVDSTGQRIITIAAWTKKRDELRRWWLDFLGPMPAERKSPPKRALLEEDRTEAVIRQLVRDEI